MDSLFSQVQHGTEALPTPVNISSHADRISKTSAPRKDSTNDRKKKKTFEVDVQHNHPTDKEQQVPHGCQPYCPPLTFIYVCVCFGLQKEQIDIMAVFTTTRFK